MNNQPPQRFSEEELSDAYDQLQTTVAEIAVTRDWDKFADMFTVDALYIEHAMGTMRGREEIRTWIWKTMEAFPGSHMTAFPALWRVIDAPTSRIISEVDNPMRDPGDGTIITATNITIMTYAGNGLWQQEEDVYNPLLFGAAAKKWCSKAEQLGTLDESAARWLAGPGKYLP